jgi:beta-galactosidase/beta-glucuronidase
MLLSEKPDYRLYFAGKQITLMFDGAMSEARIYVNGKEIGFWPWGYNSFYFDVTPYVNKDGQANTLAVRLENRPQSSRWYPGAGLYRNVHVIATDDIHVPVWGTKLTTPHVSVDYASVILLTTINLPMVKVCSTMPCMVTGCLRGRLPGVPDCQERDLWRRS